MGYGFYYFNFTYFWIMVPALIITMIAQSRVRSTFSKYSHIRTKGQVTGAEAAQRVAHFGGVDRLFIKRIAGNLTDNFDPRNDTISLSESVYSSVSVSAVGVAAHEAGHAIQNVEGYFPNKIRTALVPVTNFGSRLSMPLILIGLILPVQYDFIVYAGIILYSLVVLFQLVTLPVEFNASARAIRALDDAGILDSEELDGAKKVLRAAAMTYLAASFTALLTLLRFVLLASNRRGRR